MSEAGKDLDATEQAILFAAARADHVDDLIAPALEEGRWVVCDRFVDSTEAYQGVAGASGGVMAALRTVAVGAVMPDLTFVLDLPAELGRERAADRDALDHFEQDALTVQRARRDAFLEIAARHPQRCVVVDATLSQYEIAGAIWNVVAERLLPTATI